MSYLLLNVSRLRGNVLLVKGRKKGWMRVLRAGQYCWGERISGIWPKMAIPREKKQSVTCIREKE